MTIEYEVSEQYTTIYEVRGRGCYSYCWDHPDAQSDC